VFNKALEPILNSALIAALSTRAKQLETTLCRNLRATIEAQVKTLLSVVAPSGKPIELAN